MFLDLVVRWAVKAGEALLAGSSAGFRVRGSGFRVQGIGFRVWGLRVRVLCSGFRI